MNLRELLDNLNQGISERHYHYLKANTPLKIITKDSGHRPDGYERQRERIKQYEAEHNINHSIQGLDFT